jgi:hypothetical protein
VKNRIAAVSTDPLCLDGELYRFRLLCLKAPRCVAPRLSWSNCERTTGDLEVSGASYDLVAINALRYPGVDGGKTTREDLFPRSPFLATFRFAHAVSILPRNYNRTVE